MLLQVQREKTPKNRHIINNTLILASAQRLHLIGHHFSPKIVWQILEWRD